LSAEVEGFRRGALKKGIRRSIARRFMTDVDTWVKLCEKDKENILWIELQHVN
jgi:hypothetical protein